MTLKVLLLCCGIVLSLLPAEVSLGADRYVSPNGDDLDGKNDCLDPNAPCKTIKQAITRALPQDSIKVSSGSYTECGISVEKKLTILAVGFSVVIAPEKNLDDEECRGFVFKFSGPDANESSLEGFTIRASVKDQENAVAVWLEGVSQVTIRRNSIALKRASGASTEPAGIGIYVVKSSSIRISDNTISGIPTEPGTKDGIRIEGGADYQVAGNRISKQAGNGIIIIGVITTERSTQLFNNRVEENGRVGVNIINSSGIELQENTVIGNRFEGISFLGNCGDSPCSNIRLVKNQALFNEKDGIIFVEGGKFQSVKLLDNTLQNNGASGLIMGKNLYEQLDITNNMIERNKGAGLKIELQPNSRDIKLNGNTVRFQSGGHGIEINVEQPVVNLQLLQNNLNGNAKSGLFFQGSNAQIVKNEASANKGSGIEVKGDGNMISENITNNNQQYGIVVKEKSSNNVISANSSNNNAQGGLRLEKDSSNNRLDANTLVNNHCFGLVLEGSQNNTVTANVIQLNGLNCPDAGSFGLNSAGIQISGASRNNQFEKNKVVRNLNGISVSLSELSASNLFQFNHIAQNYRSGIQLLTMAEGSVDFAGRNNICGNGNFGLRNFTTIKVSAQNNWWGHSSGPWHENNTSGKGDRILGPAEFEPWLKQAVDVSRCP
jgi:parallel beta-helix repeat protein